jgi:hypothetical protein
VFGGIGTGITGIPGCGGAGCVGTGSKGGGCAGAGCIGGMGIGPGFKDCPGTFRTTITLMTVRDKNVRIFLFFIIFSFKVVCVW